MYHTKKYNSQFFFFFFTLAAEFTKQFYIKNSCYLQYMSEQLVLSQIEGLTIVVHLESAPNNHCGIQSIMNHRVV